MHELQLVSRCAGEAAEANACHGAVQEGDLATLLKKRGGKLLSEEEIMLKFVQICLGLMHVHNKVGAAVG